MHHCHRHTTLTNESTMIRELLDDFISAITTAWQNIRSLANQKQLMILVFAVSFCLFAVSYRYAIRRTIESWDRIEYDWD